MPRYRFEYGLETPLWCGNDVVLTFGGSPVELLFSKRIDESTITLRTVVEGANWLAANETAMDDIVGPVLDAVSLHKKAPAMLMDLLSVVKGDDAAIRRAVVIEHRLEQRTPRVNEVEVREIQALLGREARLPRAVARWLRYSYRRMTALDRFVFSWVAFENRAGTTQVPRKCAKCGEDQPSFPALNKEEAYAVLHAEDQTLTREQFENLLREWRNELRNPVFHGGRAVTTSMRGRMNEAMRRYRVAVEHHLQREAGYEISYQGDTPQDGVLQFDIYHFIEFRVNDAHVEFAQPPEAASVSAMVEGRQELDGVTLLDYGRDARNW